MTRLQFSEGRYAGALEERPDLVGYDFRRSDRISREQVRALEVAHELFSRRVASGFGTALRSLVQLDQVAVDQLTFDDYVRSMPNPTVVATVAVPPLPGVLTVELDVQMALLLVDRMLGGRHVRAHGLPPRRPTELETHLLTDLLGHAVTALGETLAGIDPVQATLTSLEFNPQLVQVAAPSDPVLLIAYQLTVSQGLETEGLLTLCYPSVVLGALLEGMEVQQAPELMPTVTDDAHTKAAVARRLHDVEVTLGARLRDSAIPASDVAALQVGDVLRLEHRVDEPAHLHLGDLPLLAAHLGRRGRRLAVQVERWLPDAGHVRNEEQQ